jgi:hypothetical protein
MADNEILFLVRAGNAWLWLAGILDHLQQWRPVLVTKRCISLAAKGGAAERKCSLL